MKCQGMETRDIRLHRVHVNKPIVCNNVVHTKVECARFTPSADACIWNVQQCTNPLIAMEMADAASIAHSSSSAGHSRIANSRASSTWVRVMTPSAMSRLHWLDPSSWSYRVAR